MARNDEKNYRRKQCFIKKDFQARFILRFSLLILVGSIISTGLLFYISQDTLTSSFHRSRLVVQSTGEAILPAVLMTNLVTFILISLAAVAVCLFVSHKIAGPLFRFEKEINDIGSGNLTRRINLRQKDQLTGLAESLNNMTAGLHAQITGVRDQVAGLAAIAAVHDTPEPVVAELKNIQAAIEAVYTL